MRVVIVGAAGRMGRALRTALDERPGAVLVGLVDRQADPAAGISTDLDALLPDADVVIDFSSPQATASNLAACARLGCAVLVGTTGLSAEAHAAAAAAAERVAVITAANTSLGVTLLVELVRAAARALPADFDIEIIEGHHRHKKDAPSGTALALGRAAAAGRGQELAAVMAPERRGDAPRREGEIGFAVVRGGDIVGDHTVLFAGSGERVAISHQATDRAIFARGALQAAAWLVGKPPGRYEMIDIIGVKTIS
ncbi:MAG: 4-hydroxy-tetrahydrodipicolinate reductase [Gammaproteobacteria bacterium]|nr:4-hydroxy-tetrahydrodipicolinate reductase [Gammaproteobacteria bacterium]